VNIKKEIWASHGSDKVLKCDTVGVVDVYDVSENLSANTTRMDAVVYNQVL